ncbi:hypothetical protein BC829DRAFT_58025 [Chytridium lagenaria]|nr:hypothetical protein BC829DRAFT_58025 [Chytridium lagenaria]
MALLWPSNTLTLPNFTIPAIPSLTVSSIRTFPECITAARLPCVATTSLSALQSCDQWKCGAIVFDRTGMTFVVVSSPVRVVSGTLISLQIMGGAEVVFGNSATSVLMPGLTLSPLSQLTLTNPTHTSTTRVSTPSTTISNQPPISKNPPTSTSPSRRHPQLTKKPPSPQKSLVASLDSLLSC